MFDELSITAIYNDNWFKHVQMQYFTAASITGKINFNFMKNTWFNSIKLFNKYQTTESADISLSSFASGDYWTLSSKR